MIAAVPLSRDAWHLCGHNAWMTPVSVVERLVILSTVKPATMIL
jgi:hypothetical protein